MNIAPIFSVLIQAKLIAINDLRNGDYSYEDCLDLLETYQVSNYNQRVIQENQAKEAKSNE